jgi:UDP-N-acetylmuramate dehydrogenase
MHKTVMAELTGKDAFAGELLVNEPMKGHTTLRIGGPADIFAEPRDMISLRNLLNALREEDIPAMPVGGGSNLLVSDEGIEGAVISTACLNHMEVIEEDDGCTRLFAEAGTPLGRLVNFTKEKGWKGVEGLAGIPGFIGGAICGNAGSFGYEIGDVIESVTAMEGNGKILSLSRGDLAFGYRASGVPGGIIVISANMRFQRDDAQEVAKRVNEFLREKLAKQPVSQFSAGCVFKNPTGLRAGMLIDQAGCKGMTRGDIEVSGLHANFFVNKGGGTFADFAALMDAVGEKVLKSSGVALEPEIKIMGRHGER